LAGVDIVAAHQVGGRVDVVVDDQPRVVVGALTLHYEALALADDGDQLLTVYAAKPGTRDAERLAQLSAPSRFAA
jgi:MmyB-like transcription regulator ligand binding domain